MKVRSPWWKSHVGSSSLKVPGTVWSDVGKQPPELWNPGSMENAEDQGPGKEIFVIYDPRNAASWEYKVLGIQELETKNFVNVGH